MSSGCLWGRVEEGSGVLSSSHHHLYDEAVRFLLEDCYFPSLIWIDEQPQHIQIGKRLNQFWVKKKIGKGTFFNLVYLKESLSLEDEEEDSSSLLLKQEILGLDMFFKKISLTRFLYLQESSKFLRGLRIKKKKEGRKKGTVHHFF